MDASALERAISTAEKSLDAVFPWLIVANAVVVIGLIIEYGPDVKKLLRACPLDASLLIEMVGAILVTAGVAGELTTLYFQSHAENDLRVATHRYVALLGVTAAQLSKDGETAKAAIATAQKDAAGAMERAAIAEQKTAELNILLEKMKAWRIVSDANRELIAKALKTFSGTKFDVAIAENDTEITSLLETIEGALAGAGWSEISWDSESIMYTRPGRPSGGIRGATGVNILVDPASEPALNAAATALEKSLNDAGIPALAHVMSEGILTETAVDNRAAIHVVVGKKTFPKP